MNYFKVDQKVRIASAKVLKQQNNWWPEDAYRKSSEAGKIVTISQIQEENREDEYGKYNAYRVKEHPYFIWRDSWLEPLMKTTKKGFYPKTLVRIKTETTEEFKPWRDFEGAVKEKQIDDEGIIYYSLYGCHEQGEYIWFPESIVEKIMDN